MFQITPIASILFLTTAVNLITAYLSRNRRHTRSGLYFNWAMIAMTFWTLAAALGYSATSLKWKILFAKLDSVGYHSALILFFFRRFVLRRNGPLG